MVSCRYVFLYISLWISTAELSEGKKEAVLYLTVFIAIAVMQFGMCINIEYNK
jgi:hypothetical protein